MMCRPNGLARSATARATWPKAMRPKVRPLSLRSDPPLGHHHLFDERVVGYDVEAERLGALGDGAGDMAKGDEAQGQAPEPRDLQQCRTPFRPAAFAHHAILLDKSAVGREHQPHRMVGD